MSQKSVFWWSQADCCGIFAKDGTKCLLQELEAFDETAQTTEPEKRGTVELEIIL